MVLGSGADGECPAFRRDAMQLGKPTDVDQVRRLRKPLFERRDERHSARQQLGLRMPYGVRNR